MYSWQLLYMTINTLLRRTPDWKMVINIFIVDQILIICLIKKSIFRDRDYYALTEPEAGSQDFFCRAKLVLYVKGQVRDLKRLKNRRFKVWISSLPQLHLENFSHALQMKKAYRDIVRRSCSCHSTGANFVVGIYRGAFKYRPPFERSKLQSCQPLHPPSPSPSPSRAQTVNAFCHELFTWALEGGPRSLLLQARP